MKKLITVAVAGCALAFPGASARADVWSDCEAWYCGGVDKNGNRSFDNGELVDIRHFADAARFSHKPFRYCAAYQEPNFAFSYETITSAAACRTFEQHCITLDPIDGSNAYRSGLRFPNRRVYNRDIDVEDNNGGLSLITNAEFTALFRFRQADDYPAAYADSRCYLVDFGNGQDKANHIDGGKHGFLLATGNSPSDNQLYVNEADKQYPTGLYLTNSVVAAKEGVWTELGVVARGKKLSFCLIQPGCTPVWQDYTLKVNVDGIPVQGGLYFGYYFGAAGTYFKGQLNMAAFWNRALSTNEVVSAFAGGAPNLFQLGCEPGGNEMFTGQVDNVTVDPATAENFAPVPKTLTDGMTLKIKYELNHWQTNLTEVLRLAPAAGAGTFDVSVNEVPVGTVSVSAGRVSLLKIDRAHFAQAAADNTLKLVFHGPSVSLDAVTLGGSWRLGLADGSNGEFGAFRSKKNVGETASGAGFEEVSGKIDAAVAALANPTNYKKSVNNPGTVPNQDGKVQRLSFDVPAALKASARMTFTTKLTGSTPSLVGGSEDWKIRVMVNGETRYVKKAKQLDGSGLEHVLPLDPAWLVPGENVLEIRPDGNVDGDPNKGATLYFDYYSLETTRVVPGGLTLLVR